MEESRRLVELERKIKTGLNTFVEVGEALLEIRDSKLYRIEHKTFEAYCRDKWQMSKQRANQLVAASCVVDAITKMTTNVVIPKTEAQVRPLGKLEPEDQPKAWAKAVELAGGEQPTAKQVEAASVEIKKESKPEHESRWEKQNIPKYIPAAGMTIANNAIRILGTINDNDTEKEMALKMVIKFCESELS